MIASTRRTSGCGVWMGGISLPFPHSFHPDFSPMMVELEGGASLEDLGSMVSRLSPPHRCTLSARQLRRPSAPGEGPAGRGALCS